MSSLQWIFAVGPVLGAGALAAWGIWSVWRIEHALAGGLERTLDALRRLDIDSVASREQHEEIRGLVIEAEGVFPALEHAWVQFEESLVQLEGQPRAPQSARTFFESRLLEAGHRARLGGGAGRETLDSLPGILGTLGFIGALAVVALGVTDLLTGGLVASDGVKETGVALLRTAGVALVPLIGCLIIRAALGISVTRSRGGLVRQTQQLVLWLDRHYRSVSAVEVLARILERAGGDGGALRVGGAATAERDASERTDGD